MPIEDQAYVAGSVSVFDGASGLMRTLLNFITGTEVAGESLSGGPVTFSGTLANSPVGLGRLIVDYDFSATPYQATDDGAGNITGTNISSGSITYSTGAYSITFSSAPDATPTVDYLYGNPGQDWRQLLFRNTRDDQLTPGEPFGSDCKECVIQNTGVSGRENVMVGIREWKYTAGDIHNWDLNGYISFITDQDWNANSNLHLQTSYDSTLECWDTHPQIPLQDDIMYYWIFSNRQRIVLVVKVSSNYESIYLGFGRRFGLPTEYPYPLIIKGSAYNGVRFSDTSGWRMFVARSYWGATGYMFWVVDPSNAYRIPYGSTQFDERGTYIDPRSVAWETALGTLGKTPTNEYVFLQPNYIVDPDNSRVLMDLDGVFLSASAGIQSEDVLHAGGVKHRVFQDVHKTGYADFMAVEQEVGTTTTTSTTTSTTSTTVTTTTVTSTTTTTTT